MTSTTITADRHDMFGYLDACEQAVRVPVPDPADLALYLAASLVYTAATDGDIAETYDEYQIALGSVAVPDLIEALCVISADAFYPIEPM